MVTTLSEMTKLWEKTLRRIKETLNDNRTFDYFFANSYIDDREGDTLIIVAASLVAKNVMQDKYSELIVDTISEFVEDIYKIRVVTEDELSTKREQKPTDKPAAKKDASPFFENADVDKNHTFDNFVVGEFNKDAHKAALYVAKNGGTLFNPLFIYSHSGLGKTHLLHAIGNEIRASRMPNAKILYINANDFVEAYVKFVRAETDSQTLKDFFKTVDVLLLDDVQLLSGKVKTQEMFFTIYQDLVNKGKRIIITSDRQPNELNGLEDRLVTRFSKGLTVKINEPDTETCVEILKQKIKENGMSVEKFDENVIYFIAEKFSHNVRDLQGALNSLMFNCLDLLDEEKITMDVAIKAVSSIIGGRDVANQLSEQKIINTVADYYNLTPSQITGKVRTGQISLARHISMYLIRKHLDIPLKKIGDMFGGKDHTTVMSGIQKVDKELKTNKQLQDAIAELEKRLAE